LRSGLTRGNGISLIVAGLVAALSVTLAGCGGSDQLTSLKRTLENPFRKDKAKLPGERIAVITDPNMIALDPAEGERVAKLLGDKEIVFMRNHGPMVVGPDIGQQPLDPADHRFARQRPVHLAEPVAPVLPREP